MCSSRNCRHKKKPLPKFIATTLDEIRSPYEPYCKFGQTAQEAIQEMIDDVGAELKDIVVFSITKAGTTKVEIVWEEEK